MTYTHCYHRVKTDNSFRRNITVIPKAKSWIKMYRNHKKLNHSHEKQFNFYLYSNKTKKLTKLFTVLTNSNDHNKSLSNSSSKNLQTLNNSRSDIHSHKSNDRVSTGMFFNNPDLNPNPKPHHQKLGLSSKKLYTHSNAHLYQHSNNSNISSNLTKYSFKFITPSTLH